MTVCGITAEYNPFHTGHLHHIAETRRSLGENAVIVLRDERQFRPARRFCRAG